MKLVKNQHAVALGRRGGKRTLERYGKAYFSRLAQDHGRLLAMRYGADYFKRIRRGERPSEDIPKNIA